MEYRIPVGSELSAGGNESWVSENEIFAFGFAQDSASVREQFLLAIWYYGLPDHPTIVWSPNRWISCFDLVPPILSFSSFLSFRLMQRFSGAKRRGGATGKLRRTRAQRR